MTDLNLSREERARFFAYCIRESEQYKALAEQMKKMPGETFELLAKKEKQKAGAYAIVAMDIDPANWEEVTLDSK